MCGLIGLAGPAVPAYIPRVEEMLSRLHHRGPDGSGAAIGPDYILGHTRLAVQDLSQAAAQPYRAGGVTLTYNGELWNAGTLDVGERETIGDTEVVAKMLDLHGIAALDAFDGMWAMAWEKDGEILLARDRWGKVPLYYATQAGSLFWASERHALPRDLQAQPVPPGGLLTAFGGQVEVSTWVPPQTPSMGLEATPEIVLALLRQGVRERLVGDRSIAFMLSGGLDSSLILALACEVIGPRNVTTYTAVLDPASPDLAAARWVADHYGVELIEVPVPLPTLQTITEAVRVIESPMKTQVEIALAHLPVMDQVAADGHAVCLSGEAADELFGGYGGMQIKASSADDEGYRAIKRAAVQKMARGNFPRVNKVGMRYGVECRLPFMQSDLVTLALDADKAASPPGKRLLRAAAAGLVPDRIIRRPKLTFQGAVGTSSAAAPLGGVTLYNQLYRQALTNHALQGVLL